MDFWGFFGSAVAVGMIILAIVFLPAITIPLIIILGGVIAFCVYRYKRIKRKVNDGRLTHEIVDFLKFNNRYNSLDSLTICENSVCVSLDHKADIYHKSFPLAKKLSSDEMLALASCVCEQIDKDRFKITHHEAHGSGSYTPEIGSVDGKTIYGKTEYYDGAEESIEVTLKPHSASNSTKFTGGSNW